MDALLPFLESVLQRVPGRPFFLRSWNGGLVHIAHAAAEVRHGRTGTSPEVFNLPFLATEAGPMQQVSLLNPEEGAAAGAYPSPALWRIERIANDEFVIRVADTVTDTYARARPDGIVDFAATAIQGWEIFRTVDAFDEIQKWSRTSSLPPIPRIRQQALLPRIIHQTYPSLALPEELQENVNTLKNRNRDYFLRLWTDSDILDFIFERYGDNILKMYTSINPSYGACRADLFRYLCIYDAGGVYLDIKSNCDRPLAELLRVTDQYILSSWDNGPDGSRRGWGIHPELDHIPGGEYQQWHVIAAAGHPFLEHVINRVLKNIASYNPGVIGTGFQGAMRLCGPIAYTLAISNVLHQHEHRFIAAEKAGFRYDAVQHHERYFSAHYTGQTHPIIDP